MSGSSMCLRSRAPSACEFNAKPRVTPRRLPIKGLVCGKNFLPGKLTDLGDTTLAVAAFDPHESRHRREDRSPFRSDSLKSPSSASYQSARWPLCISSRFILLTAVSRNGLHFHHPCVGSFAALKCLERLAGDE